MPEDLINDWLSYFTTGPGAATEDAAVESAGNGNVGLGSVVAGSVAATGTTIGNAGSSISTWAQSLIPSETSVIVWVVVLIVILLLIAYIAREVAG